MVETVFGGQPMEPDPNAYEIDYVVRLPTGDFERAFGGDWSREGAAQMARRLFGDDWGAVSVTIRRTDRVRDTRSIEEIESNIPS